MKGPGSASAGLEGQLSARLCQRWAAGPCPVGPGYEAVRLPERLAQDAVKVLDGMFGDAVGAVAAIDGWWVFLLPEGSEPGNPGWPADAEYIRAGGQVVLPPRPPGPDVYVVSDQSTWIRWRPDGQLFTAPLLLQLALDALSARTLEVSPRR